MKVTTSTIDGGTVVLKEVYNSVILETAEGNRLAVCMRDDTVEMRVMDTGKWHRADMRTGEIKQL